MFLTLRAHLFPLLLVTSLLSCALEFELPEAQATPE